MHDHGVYDQSSYSCSGYIDLPAYSGVVRARARVCLYCLNTVRLKQRLKEVGNTAPRWYQAPEVAALSSSALGSKLCEAAHKAQGVQPIDF